jgi:hypothetical protein
VGSLHDDSWLAHYDRMAVTVNDDSHAPQADFVNGTTIECDGGMLPGVLYERA